VDKREMNSLEFRKSKTTFSKESKLDD